MFPSSRNGRLDCTVVYCDTDFVVAIATFQVNTRLVCFLFFHQGVLHIQLHILTGVLLPLDGGSSSTSMGVFGGTGVPPGALKF